MKLQASVLLLVFGAFELGTISSPEPAAAAAFSIASDPYIGEIMWVPYNFAPRGWASCEGQLIAISSNQALFSLLGTTFGGDGRTTFALPDLRGRMPVHMGTGPGLTERRLGEKGGRESVTLTVEQMPSHLHTLGAKTAPVVQNRTAPDVVEAWVSTDPTGPRTDSDSTGGSQSHDNMPPYLGLHAVIALQGVFPSRN